MTIWSRDFFEIDLDKVGQPSIGNWGAKGSKEEMLEWMAHVQEIQSSCRSKGFTANDFQRLQGSSDAKEQEIYNTYCYLYKPSGYNLSVVWEGSQYSIQNGNHWILVAKQLGIRHLPAQVKAADGITLEKLKAEGEIISKFEKPLSSVQKLEWFKQVRMAQLNKPSYHLLSSPQSNLVK